MEDFTTPNYFLSCNLTKAESFSFNLSNQQNTIYLINQIWTQHTETVLQNFGQGYASYITDQSKLNGNCYCNNTNSYNIQNSNILGENGQILFQVFNYEVY